MIADLKYNRIHCYFPCVSYKVKQSLKFLKHKNTFFLNKSGSKIYNPHLTTVRFINTT